MRHRCDGAYPGACRDDPAPRVAHCIAGVARTFVHESLLLPRLFKRNLIDAVGGEPSVFLLLKTFETARKDALFRFPAMPTEDVRLGGSDEHVRPSALPTARPTRRRDVRCATAHGHGHGHGRERVQNAEARDTCT